MAKRRFGSFMMFVGLALILMMGWLVISNIRTDNAAAVTNNDLVSQVRSLMADSGSLAISPITENRSGSASGRSGQQPQSQAQSQTGQLQQPTVSARSSRLAGERGRSTSSAAVSALIPIALANRLTTPHLNMPTVSVYGYKYIGILSIPALGLDLSIMDECTNRSLDIAPGCFSGSAYDAGFVIGGHNYVSHFGRLNRLRPGNIIMFTDMNGIQFKYEVSATEVIADTAVDDLNSDVWDLSLFTCTFSGGERLVVRCLLVEE